ncbi:MAG: glycerate kinase type-2 family protein, partial [Vicinamibacteria bacterium]
RLEDKREATRVLLQCGAEIGEVNAIRQHISLLKGGRFVEAAAPARVIAFILSDVVGDRLETIASGLTVGDPTTYSDCISIAESHEILGRLPARVVRYLREGARGRRPETPKPGNPIFDRVQNVIVGSNILALEAAAAEASARGYHPFILSSSIEGEAREVAAVHAAIAREIASRGHPVSPPACLISGGETTVTVRGDGIGGRNQEFVLAGGMKIAGMAGVVIFSAGTDGIDGPTDAAGAIADGHTLARAAARGLRAMAYLDRNDAYHFFEKLGDLVLTGATGTNVMDLRLVLVGKN